MIAKDFIPKLGTNSFAIMGNLTQRHTAGADVSSIARSAILLVLMWLALPVWR
jgi:hypothetical protein